MNIWHTRVHYTADRRQRTMLYSILNCVAARANVRVCLWNCIKMFICFSLFPNRKKSKLSLTTNSLSLKFGLDSVHLSAVITDTLGFMPFHRALATDPETPFDLVTPVLLWILLPYRISYRFDIAYCNLLLFLSSQFPPFKYLVLNPKDILACDRKDWFGYSERQIGLVLVLCEKQTGLVSNTL